MGRSTYWYLFLMSRLEQLKVPWSASVFLSSGWYITYLLTTCVFCSLMVKRLLALLLFLLNGFLLGGLGVTAGDAGGIVFTGDFIHSSVMWSGVVAGVLDLAKGFGWACFGVWWAFSGLEFGAWDLAKGFLFSVLDGSVIVTVSLILVSGGFVLEKGLEWVLFDGDSSTTAASCVMLVSIAERKSVAEVSGHGFLAGPPLYKAASSVSLTPGSENIKNVEMLLWHKWRIMAYE